MEAHCIIGVTGHRNIHPKAIPLIEQAIRRWLDEQIVLYGRESLVIQSPLAAGADQIVARCGVESGIRLHVPLPFPLSRYRQDFAGTEREEFETLLECAEWVFQVTGSHEPASEADRYFAVGAYVAQRSDQLLALWDGQKEPELTGGTAHIVRCQLEGFPEAFRFGEEKKTRETCWVYTSRDTFDRERAGQINRLTLPAYKRIK